MERETKKVTTPVSKQVVEIKTYITGREKREITNSFMHGDIKYNVKENDISGFKLNSMDVQQDVAFKTIVVSVDGHKYGDSVGEGDSLKLFSIVDAILDMRDADYKFVVDSINEVTNGTITEKKTAN